MKFSKAVQEIEEYLYDVYQGINILIFNAYLDIKDESYNFGIKEDDRIYSLTVYANGKIINENGDDVIECSIDAYDFNEVYVKMLKDFKAKWYKED